MRLSVQVEVDIDVDPAATPAALARGVSEAVARMLGGDEVLLLVRGDDYILSPQRADAPAVGAWLARDAAEPPEHARVRLEKAEICRHGSPAVPGSGFLCGWC